MRIANLPTAVSNVAAGFILAFYTWEWKHRVFWPDVLALGLISAILYCAGMILNDAFDADVDAIERPSRPIPSGKITRRAAFTVGFGLIALSIALLIAMLIAAGTLRDSSISIFIVLALAIAILMYNYVLKNTWLAPAAMGSCRFLNILLGASFGFIVEFNGDSIDFNQQVLSYAVFVGMYVVGITVFARGEQRAAQSRSKLVLGSAIIVGALIAISVLPFLPHVGTTPVRSISQTKTAFVTLVVLISLPIVRRLWFAVRSAEQAAIGAAIVTSISSLIFLDAAVCFLARPAEPVYAMLIALLIVPLMLLRRLSKQT